MDILHIKDLTLRFGNDKPLFENISASVPSDKVVGLVGINGSGKSTLIKVMLGMQEIDDGEIIHSPTLQMYYVPQEVDLPAQTVREYIYDSYEYREHPEDFQKRIDSLVTKFPIDMTRDVTTLSGGQQRQVLLTKALATQAPLLLLDEPTNHLDISSLLHLQELIRDYPKTILMISHDRYFIDKTVDRIWEIEDKRIYTHDTNYTGYLLEKERRREDHRIRYIKAKKELAREHEWFISGVKARSTKDTGRSTRYYELKDWVKHNKPNYQIPRLPIPETAPLGNKILNFINYDLKLPHSESYILKEFELSMEPGMRIGILGANGSGKTTFLRSIIGDYPHARGKIIVGKNTVFNYQDQSRKELDTSLTIHQSISEENIEMKFGRLGQKTNVYAYLKQFLFGSKDLSTPISVLSGGQRARLILAHILKEGGNMWLLDEPTNDLDVDTLEALENTLKKFDGSLIMVSHDRYFLDQICTHIIALEGDGKYTISTGGYTDYITKYADEDTFWSGAVKQIQEEQKPEAKEPTDNSSIQARPKYRPAEIRKFKQQLRAIEQETEIIDVKMQEIQKIIAHKQFYTKEYLTIQREHKKLNDLQSRKDALETRWLTISDKFESI